MTLYGHALSPELHRLLRGPVPTQMLRWVESKTRARVLGQVALEGGTASAVHLLSLAGETTASYRVVLRRYVLEWVRDEPWAPGNEATILGLLSGGLMRVPAPQLLAADPGGAVDGTPATLMSALPGSVVWNPSQHEAWLLGLAEMLTRIHDLPPTAGLSEWAPYPPESDDPPAWSRHPRAWETAIEQFHGQRPDSDRVFLHRDYHPGNILWSANAITGVVDWVASCAGPSEEDVAHCRANLARHHGQHCADRFLEIWQALTGRREYHPYWDLTTVVSMSAEGPDPKLDDFVAAAAARL